MKKLIYSATLIAVVGLTGCGNTEKENLGGTTNTEEVQTESTDTSKAETEESKATSNDINQVIVDNENLKATLVKIVKKSDDIWGNSYEIIFDVENKRADKIEVQARSVSADGRMVEETLLSMSQEVAPGKTAKATLQISEYEGYEFPELNSDFEMELHVFSWDNDEYNEDHPVKVSF